MGIKILKGHLTAPISSSKVAYHGQQQKQTVNVKINIPEAKTKKRRRRVKKPIIDSKKEPLQITQSTRPITFYTQPYLSNSIMEENRIRAERANTLGSYNMGNIMNQQRAVNLLTNDDPTTNNLNNSTFDAGKIHPKLPNVNFSLTTLNANERGDNALSNLVSQEKKGSEQIKVNEVFDEQLIEEEENEIQGLGEPEKVVIEALIKPKTLSNMGKEELINLYLEKTQTRPFEEKLRPLELQGLTVKQVRATLKGILDEEKQILKTIQTLEFEKQKAENRLKKKQKPKTMAQIDQTISDIQDQIIRERAKLKTYGGIFIESE